MVSNSAEIIQDVRVQFEQLIDFVSGTAVKSATADQIERGLFRMLVTLGYHLLSLFFAMRSEASSRETLTTAENQVLPYHRDTARH